MFKAWLVYTRKKINLRRLETAFTRKRNQRILSKYWYLAKTRYDYCAELSETASRVVQEKNRSLMTQALSHWVYRLQVRDTTLVLHSLTQCYFICYYSQLSISQSCGDYFLQVQITRSAN